MKYLRSNSRNHQIYDMILKEPGVTRACVSSCWRDAQATDSWVRVDINRMIHAGVLREEPVAGRGSGKLFVDRGIDIR